MILSKSILNNIATASVSAPDAALLQLPEKVLQFGTGVLLRGLPDYFIDKANRQGIFNGRIVVVKSTAQGDRSAFEKQDGLYTLCIRGIEEGREVKENIINASISRVLSAAEEWGEVLACAHNPAMQIIISNTTEVGIQLVHDDVHLRPPVSFPGKLLSFLYERFKAFGGSAESGMIVIPTELIPDNGKTLERIVTELAHLNGLGSTFIEWLERHNHFCNSLVDRIVPGAPDAVQKSAMEEEWGYTDNLTAIAEVYRLWAIEGGEEVKKALSFAQADKGVVIAPDIESYRELKLRLLNGTHTLSCAIAFLSGCSTVKNAMGHEAVAAYMHSLLHQELVPAIPYALDAAAAHHFGDQVLERFRNPYIQHQWIAISVQYSSKMKIRVLPMLLQHYKMHGTPPPLMALGFAAYIFFLKQVQCIDENYFGEYNGAAYPIKDDRAETFYKIWQNASAETAIEKILKDADIWGEDLSALPLFMQAVLDYFYSITSDGIGAALKKADAKTVVP